MSTRFFILIVYLILLDIMTVFLYLWGASFEWLGWGGVMEALILMTLMGIVGYWVLGNMRFKLDR